MQQITDNLSNYKQNKSLPDCALKKPLERIKEICAVLSVATDKTLIHNNLSLLQIEIRRYDVERFGFEELPF